MCELFATHITRRAVLQAGAASVFGGTLAHAVSPAASHAPFFEAVDFEPREVYRTPRKPAYTSWVSLFPGRDGHWSISCDEVYATDPPQPRSSLDHWYRMGLPDGYDKSPLAMEIVLLQSADACATWKVLSRQPVRFQHSAGSFAAAHTSDGRLLRGLWSCYRLDGKAHPGEILYESADGGKTWQKLPALLDARFAPYPHRMKQLRDGTVVLAVPISQMWGADADLPLRTSTRLQAENELQMTLFFSFDEGRSWEGPLVVFPGQTVSETDFVQLPGGDLLLLNKSIFAVPGRQCVYRSGRRFVPGPFLRADGQRVPECVVLTQEGVLVGAMRNGRYSWSDDEGRTWNELAGTARCGYQPMIRQMDDGRILCAWHRGADDAFADADQFIGIDLFRLNVHRKTIGTRLRIERNYNGKTGRFLNAYTLNLTAGGKPLSGKKVEVWYVARGQPGYDSWNHTPIAQRMQQAGKLVAAITDQSGQAQVRLPEFDATTDPHISYQLFARFNVDRSDPHFKPATTPQSEFYALHHANGV